MNARSQVFELSLEGRQVDEAVASIFHTVLFHRSLGKFRYKQEGSYSVGTVGYEDVDCDFIDFTYVCCASENLDRTLKREISVFSEALRSHDGQRSGQITLEFFQKKRTRWPFPHECIPWEVWTVRLELIKLKNEHGRFHTKATSDMRHMSLEDFISRTQACVASHAATLFLIEEEKQLCGKKRQICRERIGDMLTEKIMYIAEVMNRHEYVPKMPNQSDLDLVFDTTYPDVQPYLFKISFSTCGPSSPSVGTTMRKLIKETLSL